MHLSYRFYTLFHLVDIHDLVITLLYLHEHWTSFPSNIKLYSKQHLTWRMKKIWILLLNKKKNLIFFDIPETLSTTSLPLERFLLYNSSKNVCLMFTLYLWKIVTQSKSGIIIFWQLQNKLYYFLEMLKYFKITFLKEKYFVKKNEMFWNIYVFNMESSKIN